MLQMTCAGSSSAPPLGGVALSPLEKTLDELQRSTCVRSSEKKSADDLQRRPSELAARALDPFRDVLFQPSVDVPEERSHQQTVPREFLPTHEWQPVPKNSICPAGLHFRIDVATGLTFARLPFSSE